MSELVSMIDDHVFIQYRDYAETHERTDLAFGHNRVVAFEEVMQQTYLLLASRLLKMSPHNDWLFRRLLKARELRLLNKAGANIDLDDFDPDLTDERV